MVSYHNMAYIGNHQVTKFYIGDNPLDKLYRGNTLLWEDSEVETDIVLTFIVSANTIVHVVHSARTSQFSSMIMDDGLYTIDSDGTCTVPEGTHTARLTPNTTSLANGTFQDCSFNTAYIPDSITSMGTFMFWGCHNVTEIRLSNISHLYDGFCWDCWSLSSITIPESVTYIGGKAFAGCMSLQSLTFGSGITEVGSNAFTGDTNLTSVTFNTTTPPNMNSDNAFDGTNNCPIYVPRESVLAYRNSIPNWKALASRIQPMGATIATNTIVYTATSKPSPKSSGWGTNVSISSNTFDTATGIGIIVFSGGTTNGLVTTIPYNAFGSSTNAKKVTSVILPTSVTGISANAFQNCSALSSITIESGAVTVGDYAFQSCSALTSFQFYSLYGNLGPCAFSGCTSLTEVYIGPYITGTTSGTVFQSCKGLTKIIYDTRYHFSLSFGSSIQYPNLRTVIIESGTTMATIYLNGPTGITSVTSYATTPPSGAVSLGVTFTYPIYVPAGSVDAYKTSIYWKDYANKICIPTNTVVYSAPSKPTPVTTGWGATYISNTYDSTTGKGILEFEGDVTTVPTNALGNSITSVIIPRNTTSISVSAFTDCSSLTSVTIDSTGVTIGDYAFYGCSGLTSFPFSKVVGQLYANTFKNCSITEVTLGPNLTKISASAFENDSNITTVILDTRVSDSDFGSGCFASCTGITSVTIQNNVPYIGTSCFNGCSGLTSITSNATTPPTLAGSSTFRDTNDCPIYVPTDLVDTYKEAEYWSTYADRIQAIPSA